MFLEISNITQTADEIYYIIERITMCINPTLYYSEMV